MSSYLNIYVVPKTQSEDAKHLTLMCFSSSHELYHTITECINVAYAGESEIYTDLTEENMLEILQEVSNDISRMEKRLVEYEKYAAHNTDLITEIIEGKSYLEELVRTKHYVEMIQALVWNTNHGFNSFNKVCCNIG